MTWAKLWAAITWEDVPIWTPSAGIGFDVDHLLAGIVFGSVGQLIGLPLLAPVTLCIAWTCLKEWGFDMLCERDSILGSARDTAGYLVGVAVWTAIRFWAFP